MSSDECRAVTVNLLNEWAGRIVAEQAVPKFTVAVCQGGGLDAGRVVVCTPKGTTNAELLHLRRFVLAEVEQIEARTGPYALVETPAENATPRAARGE
jgi:hypothetical protein